jgi:hypothetical protein
MVRFRSDRILDSDSVTTGRPRPSRLALQTLVPRCRGSWQICRDRLAVLPLPATDVCTRLWQFLERCNKTPFSRRKQR